MSSVLPSPSFLSPSFLRDAGLPGASPAVRGKTAEEPAWRGRGEGTEEGGCSAKECHTGLGRLAVSRKPAKKNPSVFWVLIRLPKELNNRVKLVLAAALPMQPNYGVLNPTRTPTAFSPRPPTIHKL